MSKRINGSAVEFSFLRGECLKNNFIDISNFGRNSIGTFFWSNVRQDSTSCLLSNGAGAINSPLESSKNISNLLNHFRSSSSLTIEFWLQPNGTNSVDSTIFSISSSSIISPSVATGCGYNLRVSTTYCVCHIAFVIFLIARLSKSSLFRIPQVHDRLSHFNGYEKSKSLTFLLDRILCRSVQFKRNFNGEIPFR